MDRLDEYRDIVERSLKKVVAVPYSVPNVKARAVLDRHSDNYVVVREGWEGVRHIVNVVVHIEIRDGKIWILEDWLEHGIAADLEEAGIPKSDIVLGFYPADVRPHTGYAVA